MLVLSVVVDHVCDGSGYNIPLSVWSLLLMVSLVWHLVTGFAARVSVRRFEERGVVGAGRDSEKGGDDDNPLLFNPMPNFVSSTTTAFFFCLAT